MAQFLNPYHFVPVVAFEGEGAGWVRRGERPEAVAHDRYVKGTLSGRIVARLTTVTPTVVGGKHTPGEPTGVEPFRVDGKAAIPASTLRGMIGAVVEAASNGPLRILEDRKYSYRKSMKESLSAIGMIAEKEGKLWLRPMCLPTLESHDEGRTFQVSSRFARLFPNGPQFKVYVGGYEEIRGADFPATSKGSEEAVIRRVNQLEWRRDERGRAFVRRDHSLNIKEIKSKDWKSGRERTSYFTVAQKPDSTAEARKGMLRVLGCDGDRAKEMPTKKHELWLPLPDERGPWVAIPDDTLRRFEELADERTDSDPRYPFEPKGTRPGRKEATGPGARLRLQTGDMVYFDVDEGASKVTEVSFSSIWRGQTGDSSHEFFPREHRPFGPDREHISAAEHLLGFVEDVGKGKTPHVDGNLALASRVRFGDGLAADGGPGRIDDEVILRILDSPKPPSPSLYFKNRRGEGTISKGDLASSKHAAQGRKWYLHMDAGEQKPWATEKQKINEMTAEEGKSLKQKSLVTPLSARQAFCFHIDFDNLTQVELGLLLYALEPGEEFHHKLGMGKPLGLGTVKVETLAICTIDREGRYSGKGLRANRYSSHEFREAGQKLLRENTWPSRYEAEVADAIPGEACKLWDTARSQLKASGLIPDEVGQALMVLGRYEAGRTPGPENVHYPTTMGNGRSEANHYEWFVANDAQRKPPPQHLTPLNGREDLPRLDELRPRQRQR